MDKVRTVPDRDAREVLETGVDQIPGIMGLRYWFSGLNASPWASYERGVKRAAEERSLSLPEQERSRESARIAGKNLYI